MENDDFPLFSIPKVVGPARENNPLRKNLRRASAEWITQHPKAGALLIRFAQELAARKRRFGIGLLTERLRWEAAIEGWADDEYKVNNSYRAYLARWLIMQDPRLEQFVRFREVQW